MRRLLTWLSGAVGGIALYRLLTRRRVPLPEPVAPGPQADPRADELRARLDASRPLVDAREEFEGGEQPVDAVDLDPEERRRRVHEEGRTAVEDMRRSSES